MLIIIFSYMPRSNHVHANTYKITSSVTQYRVRMRLYLQPTTKTDFRKVLIKTIKMNTLYIYII